MLKKYIKNIESNKYLKVITEFSLLQFFFWSTWAIYGGYLVYYLGEIGYSNIRIGTLMSLRTFTGLIGPPVIGFICDKIESRKKVFIISMLLMGIIVAPFTFYGDYMLFIAIGVMGFLWEPQQSVLDSWIIETSEKTALNYGFMRAWGSIGFAIIVTIFGLVIEFFGWTVHFLSYGLAAFIVVVIALMIEDNSYQIPDDLKSNPTKQKTNLKNLVKLLKDPEYLFILSVTLLIFIPAMMIMVYLAPIVQSVGGDSRDLGYILFFNALSEAPIFFMAKHFLQRYKTRALLLFAAIFYLLRTIIVALAVSPTQLIFYGLLQSLSFGVFLVTVRYYVKLIAPTGLKTTAQSIILMSAFGGGGIIGSLLGGFLIDTFGMNSMFAVSIAFSLLAVIVLFFSVIQKS
ncbi:MFS transporter [Halanaerobium hydrogeniformans]|uniref:Major facilitator superfamily MFS_1 n=1 Tax=Halanaerobium hydrogeniformans TaxID=656519 RepID=E4RJT4_HALHG|nr:MFS transporter [Halanaerobium hydrogeniformans]ADQ15504.1 major facilitator superfamily MFS_1 [Halanaerobium hydrogeniformans]